jgi:hypothetical protein
MANEENSYTNLHLSALTFLHPPNPPDHQFQCHCCEQSSSKLDRMKHIRVYHNEPSGYAYNSDCYLIKESRYSTIQKWHAPSDDLVADDAAVGSAVVAVGWWIEDRKDEKDEWEVSLFTYLTLRHVTVFHGANRLVRC